MKLTSQKALEMLEESRGKAPDDGWINHSICVGNAAFKIAEALGLDAEYAITLGYIHDIGKSLDNFKNHIIGGYNYLKELGYDEEYAAICMTHSYLNNDVICTAGGIPPDKEKKAAFIAQHEYTIYDRIINLCDLICTSKVVTLEKRLIDIMIRRGVHENTVYHIKEAQKLKASFDDMLGFNLYKLFPDILDN